MHKLLVLIFSIYLYVSSSRLTEIKFAIFFFRVLFDDLFAYAVDLNLILDKYESKNHKVYDFWSALCIFLTICKEILPEDAKKSRFITIFMDWDIFSSVKSQLVYARASNTEYYFLSEKPKGDGFDVFVSFSIYNDVSEERLPSRLKV